MKLVIDVNLMLHTIQKEKKRIDYMLASYQKQLDELPKGSIASRTAGKNVYYYLKYRSGKKVYTDYLGKEGEKVDAIRASLEKRRHIKAMISNLQVEQAIANCVCQVRSATKVREKVQHLILRNIC